MTSSQGDILIFLVVVFGLAGIVVGWVVLDFLRHLLDAAHTLIAQGNKRREWNRQEHTVD